MQNSMLSINFNTPAFVVRPDTTSEMCLLRPPWAMIWRPQMARERESLDDRSSSHSCRKVSEHLWLNYTSIQMQSSPSTLFGVRCDEEDFFFLSPLPPSPQSPIVA